MTRNPEDHYSQIIADSGNIRRALSRRLLVIAALRLAVFAATAALLAACRHSPTIAAAVFITGLSLFLWLAGKGRETTRKKDVEAAKAAWAKDHIDRLRLKLDTLPGGDKYIDASHDFSFDIDLFGKRSLFALLNATATPFGSDKLSRWLRNPSETVRQVEERQQAIRELSEKPGFLLSVASAGRMAADETAAESVAGKEIPDFSINILQRCAVAAAPFLFAALFALMAAGVIGGTAIIYTFLAVLAIGSLQAKRVGRLHRWTEQTISRLSSYAEVFRTIEDERFSSPLLQNEQSAVAAGKKASEQTRKLARYLHNLDQRYNAFGYAIMNGFLLWDWRQLRNIDRWMRANAGSMERWEQAIADIDALCALGSFAFNNPEYTYPSYDHSRQVIIEARQAGHPLIPRSSCVANDIAPLRLSSFFVVTGANMAGKSTYLRTVAVNYLLAEIGAPVYAETMTFSEVSLFTGLRASDNLAEGASYFFAELSRLQRIVGRAGKGERMLVILDEILRGTNSADKQKGSLGLVSKLVGLPVAGIIATHDLAVGSLADTFPGRVSNWRFEADIDGDRLSFSYRIRPGIAENANATFLMLQMGII